MQQPKDDTGNSYFLPCFFMSSPVTPLILDYCIPGTKPTLFHVWQVAPVPPTHNMLQTVA